MPLSFIATQLAPFTPALGDAPRDEKSDPASVHARHLTSAFSVSDLSPVPTTGVRDRRPSLPDPMLKASDFVTRNPRGEPGTDPEGCRMHVLPSAQDDDLRAADFLLVEAPDAKACGSAATMAFPKPQPSVASDSDVPRAVPTKRWMDEEAYPPAAVSATTRNYIEIVDRGVVDREARDARTGETVHSLRTQGTLAQLCAGFKGMAQARAVGLARSKHMLTDRGKETDTEGAIKKHLNLVTDDHGAPPTAYQVVVAACGLALGLGPALAADALAVLEKTPPDSKSRSDGPWPAHERSEKQGRSDKTLMIIGMKMAANPLAALKEAAIALEHVGPLLEAVYHCMAHDEEFVRGQVRELLAQKLPPAHADRLVGQLLRGLRAVPADILRVALVLHVDEPDAAHAAGRFKRTYLQALGLDRLIRATPDREACAERMEDLLANRRAIRDELQAFGALPASEQGAQRKAAAVEVLRQLETKLTQVYQAFHTALHQAHFLLADDDLAAWRAACDPDTTPPDVLPLPLLQAGHR